MCTYIFGVVIGTSYTLENFTALWEIVAAFIVVAVALLMLSIEKYQKDLLVGVELISGDVLDDSARHIGALKQSTVHF